MTDYDKAYKKLNPEQRSAVDKIDGAVFVIAGPGTGKTELLSMRVGSILRNDPSILPSNILCLTFTDSAANNLRARLVRHIGTDAYQVSIHTFNSFGSWIINSYPENFFAANTVATADDLIRHQTLDDILKSLPGTNILAKKNDFLDKFPAMKQIKNLIDDAKTSNLKPSNLKKIIQANQNTYELLNPIINEHFPGVLRGPKAIETIDACIEMLKAAGKDLTHEILPGIPTIYSAFITDILVAQQESLEFTGAARTKPYTAWKSKWLTKSEDGSYILKNSKQTEKLLAACDVYQEYEDQLRKKNLVDFNDQIVMVLEELSKNTTLRLNLQEQFQYIMIDEYQDTNRAQLQMAQFLTDAPTHERKPNILVVGDDDQAIYRFQGADITNVTAFQTSYDQPTFITLKKNYRSNKDIIENAQKIRQQISLTLEKRLHINKDFEVMAATENSIRSGVYVNEFETESDHNSWIAKEIKKLYEQFKDGPEEEKKEIAVIARKHKQLTSLLPYLQFYEIPVDYEYKENILEQEHIRTLLDMCNLVYALNIQNLDEANELLSKVLSHSMWGIEVKKLWNVSYYAYRNKCHWIDAIYQGSDQQLKQAADFFFGLSQQAEHIPLEELLDTIIGIEPETRTLKNDHKSTEVSMRSPYKDFYFGKNDFDSNPDTYLNFLNSLRSLRDHIKEYARGTARVLYLKDLIEIVSAYQHADINMKLTTKYHNDTYSVKLMTAHKAKGQEFEAVFIIGTEHKVWEPRAYNNSRFTYPENIHEIKPTNDEPDDNLRLFYVSMTRAKQLLNICFFSKDDRGGEDQQYGPTLKLDAKAKLIHVDYLVATFEAVAEKQWFSNHANIDAASKKAVLQTLTNDYKLSPTHLNDFLDVGSGGPLYFLTKDLLHFPKSESTSAQFGTAVHETLRQAHEQFKKTGEVDYKFIIDAYEQNLARKILDATSYQRFLKKGSEVLETYLKFARDTFRKDQLTEIDFKHDGIVLFDTIHITGKIDLLDLDVKEKSIAISDYKTGKSYGKWTAQSKSDTYIAIRLHHIRQQLLFYKLLTDNSLKWSTKQGWRTETGFVRFLEANASGKIQTLSINYEADEIEYFKELIKVVWHKIMTHDFPDVQQLYSPDISGIRRFEEDLINHKI